MQPAEYKFERFSDPHFPLYLSAQSGMRTLVKIHYHTSAELIEVTSGRIRLFAAGAHRECAQGDVIFVPPTAVHEVTGLTEDAAIRGVIYEPTLTHIGGLPVDLTALFGHSTQQHFVISPGEELYAELVRCIGELHALGPSPSMAGKLRACACLLQIHAALIHCFGLENQRADPSYQKLQPALDYLREHYAQKLHISTLSGIIHVCDDRLIRLFKEVTGETPVNYLINLRLEASLKLLSSTELSIAEIADLTGFGSAAYMTRVFQQKLNTTPGKYRKK